MSLLDSNIICAIIGKAGRMLPHFQRHVNPTIATKRAQPRQCQSAQILLLLHLLPIVCNNTSNLIVGETRMSNLL